MKKYLVEIGLLLTAVFINYHGFSQQLDKLELKDRVDSISYILGYDYGNNLKSNSISINVLILAKGVQASFLDSNSIISEADKVRLMNSLKQEVGKKTEARQKIVAQENNKKGKEFLEANKKNNKKIKETSTGLQYEVISEGTGKMPKITDKVTVNYKGQLLNGKVYYSSFDTGKPAIFVLTGEIAGLTEGIQLMKEGAKYRFYIPSELAYGDAGMGVSIPPGSTVIFEVELISIQSN
jgi:FKBP-type peptidyl-prolyl cis-trans isomerase FklB